MEESREAASTTSSQSFSTTVSKRPIKDAAQTSTLSQSEVRPGRKWLVVATLVFSDLLIAASFWAIAFAFYGIITAGAPLEPTIGLVAFNTTVWVALRALVGLYPGYGLSPAEELRRQTYATASALAVTTLLAFSFQVGSHPLVLLLPAQLLALNFLQRLLLAPLARHLVKCALRKIGLWGKPIVVFGAGEPGKQLVRTLKEEWALGFNPVAVFDNRIAPVEGMFEGVPYGGTFTDAVALAGKRGLDTAIFAMPYTRRAHLARFVDLIKLNFRHVVVTLNLGGITTSSVVARDFAGIFGVEIKHNLLDPWAQRVKRALDLGAVVVGGALTLPFILLLSLLVWVESRGPIFYADMRMGRDGKLFSCLKFRTMVPDSEALLQQMLSQDEEMREEYSKYHKLRDDPRITRIGRFLRKTSLDELPQLWNVLRGEMSLVGPRPYLPRESTNIGEAQKEILRVLPGITGPWQVSGRNRTSFDERVQMDAYYIRDWSVWLDVVLLARTAKILMFREGAY